MNQLKIKKLQMILLYLIITLAVVRLRVLSMTTMMKEVIKF